MGASSCDEGLIKTNLWEIDVKLCIVIDNLFTYSTLVIKTRQTNKVCITFFEINIGKN